MGHIVTDTQARRQVHFQLFQSGRNAVVGSIPINSAPIN